jgi:hypothetical protein
MHLWWGGGVEEQMHNVNYDPGPGVYILVENGYLFPPPPPPLGNLYFFPKKTA